MTDLRCKIGWHRWKFVCLTGPMGRRRLYYVCARCNAAKNEEPEWRA